MTELSRILPSLTRWLAPAALILAGLLIGLVTERVLRGRVNGATARTTAGITDILLESLRGMPLAWFFLTGLTLALPSIPLSGRADATLREILEVLVILSLTVAAARMLAGTIDLRLGHADGTVGSTSILKNIVRLSVFSIGALFALESAGIAVRPILGALGVGGLAVALALKDTLSNLFSGIFILASRHVRVGDFVKLESGERGFVTDIRWRNTRVKTLGDNVVIVPNDKLAGSIVIRYGAPETELTFSISLGVTYRSDLDEVERVARETAREVLKDVAGGDSDFDPPVRFASFGESSIGLGVTLRARTFTDIPLLTHEFIKRMSRRFAADGVEIPYPVRTVRLARPASKE